jgi:hypothetical protein
LTRDGKPPWVECMRKSVKQTGRYVLVALVALVVSNIDEKFSVAYLYMIDQVFSKRRDEGLLLLLVACTSGPLRSLT